MKKSLSLLLVLALLVSLVAGLGVPALAEEGAPIAGAVSQATVLTVNLQAEGDVAVPIKTYNISELAALAEINEDGAAYIYYKKDAANAVVATQYVTLDAILKDAEMDFGAGDKLAFECADGPYTKGDFSYETLSARGVDAEGNAVPTALAMTWTAGSLDETTVAELATKSEFTGSLRFVCGMTAEEAEGKTAAGNRMPSDVIAITVVVPEIVALEIYTQAGKGAPEKLAKAYTGTALKEMMETVDAAAYVYYKKDAANAVVATQYVTLSALLADAGVTFAEGDSLAFTCSDGPYSKGDFSYSTLNARGVDAEGNAVPTAIALSWAAGNLDEATVADIAAKAEITGDLRFVCGMTAAEAEGKTAAGNRMPSGVIAITVVGQPVVQPSSQGLKVDGEAKTTEVYNISDYNYFKLRDIAALLNGTDAQFSVAFDTETRVVSITTGQPYEAVGGELTTGTDKSASCVLSDWKVEVNGEAKDIVAYNLEGNNFFKLRDLGTAIGFNVDYDTETATMLITSK